MRAVTDKILSDPKIVAYFNSKRRYIVYIDAAQTEKNIKTVLQSLSPKQIAEMKRVILGN